jgi:DNA-directed RNA polymerase specialized sigma24 family protein
MDNNQLIEETETHVRIAAAQTARRYRGFVTYADVAQEGVLWVLSHPGTVVSLLEDGNRGKNRLIGRLSKHMEKLARKERAQMTGYDPSDEAFYTRALLEAALPAVWDDNLLDHPPVEEMAADAPRRRSDGSETSNWLVTVLDVRKAWQDADLDLNWRLALSYRYGEGMRLWQIADALEVSDSTASNYIDRGLNALIRQLGGKPPGQCSPDCECKPVGTRRAISNAEARYLTENDYDE